MSKGFYLAIAIIAFTIPIVVMAPASIVTGLFGDAVQQNIPGLKIGATQGRHLARFHSAAVPNASRCHSVLEDGSPATAYGKSECIG